MHLTYALTTKRPPPERDSLYAMSFDTVHSSPTSVLFRYIKTSLKILDPLAAAAAPSRGHRSDAKGRSYFSLSIQYAYNSLIYLHRERCFRVFSYETVIFLCFVPSVIWSLIWTVRQPDCQTDRKTDRWMNERANRQAERYTDRQITDP